MFSLSATVLVLKPTKMKNEREVYFVTITPHDGYTHQQFLMISELHLIATITKENKSVKIERQTITLESYKNIFNVY